MIHSYTNKIQILHKMCIQHVNLINTTCDIALQHHDSKHLIFLQQISKYLCYYCALNKQFFGISSTANGYT